MSGYDNELDYVRDCIENEGFDYCFCDYSQFAEIKDRTFQELRKSYVLAAKALKEYLDI